MRIVVTGGSGQVGSYIVRELCRAGHMVTAWTGGWVGRLWDARVQQVDLCHAAQVTTAWHACRPEAVVHCAAVSSMDAAYRNPTHASRMNVDATRELRDLAVAHGVRLIHFSTDMVFDGTSLPYREDDVAAPLSVYGRTKLEADLMLCDQPGCLVLRPGLVIGPTLLGRAKFLDHLMCALREGRAMDVFVDEWRTPIDALTLARTVSHAVGMEDCGLLHVGGPQRLSRVEMARLTAKVLGVSDEALRPVSRLTIDSDEPRAADLSLDSARWRSCFPHMPWLDYEAALRAMLAGGNPA